MKFMIVFILIGFFGAAFSISRPRLPQNPKTVEEIEEYLHQMVAKNQPPGISIAVVKNGKIFYQSAFGMADAPNQIPATSKTIYHWWSMTKIPTAIAILQLYDAKLLDIDDPVSKYLPFFEVSLDGNPAPPPTIRQVLRHSSGLPDPMPAMIGWVHFEDELYNQTGLLEQHLPNYNRLNFEPDSKAQYSNLGYLVLGAIIESVSGLRYEDYIQQEILTPLRMEDTGFLYRQDDYQNIAAGSHPFLSIYTPLLPFLLDFNALVNQRTGSTFWLNPVYIDSTPSSGLLGSSSDVAKLVLALLERENLLTRSSHELMSPHGAAITESPLGWAEYNPTGRIWVQHRGGGPGFATIMRLYPDENLGIAIMANSTNLPGEKLVDALANIDW